MATIRIDSILGGQSPSTNFSRKDQFRASFGIDPALGISDILDGATPSSGLLRPVANTSIAVSLAAAPLWIKDSPKTTSTFVYDLSGSAYTMTVQSPPATGTTFNGALPDAGSLSSSSGNGCEYYDNYQYFAKNTDIARFGPLDGDAVFDGTYWTGTLGKTALSNTGYPISTLGAIQYPNHVMHRHSDGKLYIADVQGNQGAIHYIATKKTTKEGDTDDGSTLNKLLFGYGLWPTAIESYGAGLAIALFEGHVEAATVSSKSGSAKLAFWDTTSQNFNSMIFVEFPDEFISALKNINGVLYIFSGNHFGRGFRVSQYVGGYTVKEVAYFEQGFAPLPGAVDGDSARLLFGSNSLFPDGIANSVQHAAVYSLGLQRAALGHNLFVTGAVATTLDCAVYSLANMSTSLQFATPVIGWSSNAPNRGAIDYKSTDYSQSLQLWQSQVYKIGQPFEIKRIRIPLAQTLAANMTVTATVYYDEGIASQVLPVINSTNFPNAAETGYGRTANIKVAGDGTALNRGQNSFWIDLRWTGSALCVVSLPIIVEFEVIPD